MELYGHLSTAEQLSGTLSSPQVFSGIISGAQQMSGQLSNITLRGYSAYELAVLGGYEGTLEEWLESLRAQRLEIRNNDGIIEYKYENEHLWTILIDLSSYTNDYEDLINRPSLDGVVLSGDRDLTNKYVLSMNSISNSELEEMLV